MNSIPSQIPAPTTKNFTGLAGFRGKGYRVRFVLFLYELCVKFINISDRIGGPLLLEGIAFFSFLVDLPKRWHDYPRFVKFHNLRPPAFWKGTGASSHYLQMIWSWQLTCTAILAYSRLGLPYWKKRFKTSGTPPQARPDWGTRPVVLASLHVGAFPILPYWLRSLGIPAGAVVGGLPLLMENEGFRKVVVEGNSRYGLQGVPHVFQRRGPAVRAAFRFLKPGHILSMALDGGRILPEEDAYDAGGFTFYAKQGAARIAAQTNAVLIPVSVRCRGMFRFDIRYLTPVPDELLQKEDFKAATQHMVTELWKDIRENPSDLAWTGMESYAPELRGKKISWP